MKKKRTQELFDEYFSIVRRLRKECPWDREQTHRSIRHSLIEEAYEVVESIDENDLEALKGELGDLLLHVTLHALMAEEEKAFTLDDVLQTSKEKLIRRHPHVFGNTKVRDAAEVKMNWERIKLTEGRTSVLDGVPGEMPALLRASRLQEKVSKVGFDWKKKKDVWKKVDEELKELHAAERSKRRHNIEAEFGDLLFALVNYARFLKVNPEISLRHAVKKFSRRFRFVEQELEKRGKKPGQSSLEEMDELWNKGKRTLR
ncbi:MAG: nucleoside triphosphate pyrophosphohydrolase [Bacteroidota bacterium]